MVASLSIDPALQDGFHSDLVATGPMGVKCFFGEITSKRIGRIFNHRWRLSVTINEWRY